MMTTELTRSILMQQPRRWTTTHLKLAKVQGTAGARVAEMLGAEYVPADGDPELEKVAGLLCVPDAFRLRKLSKNPFHRTFRYLAMISEPHEVPPDTPRCFLLSLVGSILGEIEAGDRFVEMDRPNPPFTIPQLNFRGKVPGGVIVGVDTENDDALSIPAVILSVVDKSRPFKIPWHETPHALAPAAITYSKNPNLSHYDGFVVTLDGPLLYVSRLKASRSYMRALFEGEVVENVPLYRTGSFNIYDVAGRREIARIIIGLFRYLCEGELPKIPGNYGEGWF